jgi:hypothetical protein
MLDSVGSDRESALFHQESLLPRMLESFVEWVTERRFTTLFFPEFVKMRNAGVRSSTGILLCFKGNDPTIWTVVCPIFQKYNQRVNLFLSGYIISTNKKERGFWPTIDLENIQQGGFVTSYELKKMEESGFIQAQHYLDDSICIDGSIGDILNDRKKLEVFLSNPPLVLLPELNIDKRTLDLDYESIYSSHAYPNNSDRPEEFSMIHLKLTGWVLLDVFLLELEVFLYKGHFYLYPLTLLVRNFNRYIIPFFWKKGMDQWLLKKRYQVLSFPGTLSRSLFK